MASEMSQPGTPTDASRDWRALRLRAEAIARRVREGQHRGRGPGLGGDPDDAHPYTPGDPARAIDWRLLARRGRPFVRLRVQEASVRIGVVIDRSASMAHADKLGAACELVASLASVARRTGDRVLLIGAHAPPGTPDRRAEALYTQLRAIEPGRGRTLASDIPSPGSLGDGVDALVCVGDTFESVEPLVRALAGARHAPGGRRRRVVLVQLISREDLPAGGLVGSTLAVDPETGRRVAIEGGAVRERYAEALDAHTRQLRARLAPSGCRLVVARVEEGTGAALRKLLRAIAPGAIPSGG